MSYVTDCKYINVTYLDKANQLKNKKIEIASPSTSQIINILNILNGDLNRTSLNWFINMLKKYKLITQEIEFFIKLNE